MLVAYFDESGIHDHSKVVSVGGLIGQPREWDRLEKPWRTNLAVTGIEWFHAYECEEGVAQFENVAKGLRESLVNGLSIALVDRCLAYIGGAVFHEDWKTCASEKLRSGYANSPYAFCVAMAVIRACEFAAQFGERAALVFAVPKDADKRLVESIFDVLHQDDFPGLGSLSFGRPQDLIPLQAADLIAFETYQHLLAQWKRGLGNFPIRAAMMRFHRSERPLQIGYFDCEGLAGVSRDHPAFRDDPLFLP